MRRPETECPLLLQTLEQRVSERLEKECDFKIKIKRTCKNGK